MTTARCQVISSDGLLIQRWFSKAVFMAPSGFYCSTERIIFSTWSFRPLTFLLQFQLSHTQLLPVEAQWTWLNLGAFSLVATVSRCCRHPGSTFHGMQLALFETTWRCVIWRQHEFILCLVVLRIFLYSIKTEPTIKKMQRAFVTRFLNNG